MDFFDLIRWYRVKWCRFWSRYSSEKQIKVIRFWASTDRARNFGLTSMLTNTLPDYVRVGNRTLSYLLGGILLEGSGQGVKARTS